MLEESVASVFRVKSCIVKVEAKFSVETLIYRTVSHIDACEVSLVLRLSSGYKQKAHGIMMHKTGMPLYPMPRGNAFHYLQILSPLTLKMAAACFSETCALNVCVCMCVYIYTHTHTHTHTYIYIYIYIIFQVGCCL